MEPQNIINDTLKGDNLNDSINQIILDKNTLKDMGKNATKVSTQNVEEKIYNEIKKILKERQKS